jgi:hypothetical protein
MFSIPSKENNDFSWLKENGPTIPETFSEICEDAKEVEVVTSRYATIPGID